MKPAQELEWICKLYDSPACRDIANLKVIVKPLCKKDFERLVGASENSKIFEEWFEKLIALNIILEKGSQKSNLGNYKIYIVNKDKLIKYAEDNSLYNITRRFFNRDRVI